MQTRVAIKCTDEYDCSETLSFLTDSENPDVVEVYVGTTKILVKHSELLQGVAALLGPGRSTYPAAALKY